MARAVDDIKQRLSIVDVVGGYIKLEKAGANFKARCPFHNEKTPSFVVSPDRNSYYCFGCNAKGDIFSFVEAFEGVDFKTALVILAEKAGVNLADYRLQPRDDQQKDDTDRLYTVLDAATQFYQAELQKNDEARTYLKDRGLTEETITSWRIGFAPAEWRSVKSHLEALGFTTKELNAAGLIKQSEKSAADYYDRFRSRIMFPLFNTAGKAIGFSGRVFQSDDQAKYVNSPETVLFKKSQFLYGFHKAKEGIRRRGYTTLVEGQMDLIMCHQSGIDNTVATSGTALTEDQVKLLKRFSPKLLIAYDADKAGVQAAERAWKEAVEQGLEVKIAEIAQGKDPADALKENPAAFIEQLKKSQHVIEYLLGALSRSVRDEREFGRQVSQRVIPIVASITDPIEQAQLVSKTARALGVKEESVWEAVRKKEASAPSSQRSDSPSPDSSAGSLKQATTRADILNRRLSALRYLLQEKDPQLSYTLEQALVKATEAGFITALEAQYPKTDALLFEAEATFGGERYQVAIDEIVPLVEEEYLRATLSQSLSLLKQAERSGDTEAIKRLLKRCQDLAERLHELSGIKK
jgi:DNA primase